MLISRYTQLLFAIPFVSYCFQLDKIVHIFGTVSPISMIFSAIQSSLSVLPTKLQIKHLIVGDFRLISLDRLTYGEEGAEKIVMERSLPVELRRMSERVKWQFPGAILGLVTKINFSVFTVLLHLHITFCMN